MEEPVPEELIERFVRFPERLSEEDRRQVKRLLERSEAARTVEDFFRTFYEEFDRIEDVSSEVEAFVDSLFPAPFVIPLRPYRPTASAGSSPYPTVMAAMSQRPAHRFETLVTLAAPEEDVLVRVLRDREAGTGRLYVMTPHASGRAHVIVSFPSIGMDCVTDSRGRVEFPLSEEDTAFRRERLEAFLRRPAATLTIDQARETLGDAYVEALASGHEIRLQYGEGRLSVRLIPTALDALEISSVVVVHGEERHLLVLREGSGTIAMPVVSEALTLYLYL